MSFAVRYPDSFGSLLMIPTLINSPDAEVSAAVSVEADALSDVLSVSVDAVDEAGAEPDPHAVNPILGFLPQRYEDNGK